MSPADCGMHTAQRQWRHVHGTVSFQRLQTLRDASARLSTQTGWRKHITPILRKLHGLPFDAGLTSSWTSWCSNHCTGQLRCSCRINASWCLMSVADYGHLANSCAMPLTTAWLDLKSFAVAGPQLWNMLPASLFLVDNFAHFKRVFS